jgi:hypothetical protein
VRVEEEAAAQVEEEVLQGRGLPTPAGCFLSGRARLGTSLQAK